MLTPVLIYGGSFLIGAAQAFQSPSVRALLPSLVDREIRRRRSHGRARPKAAVIAGPAIGGLVYLAGPSYVYAMSAVLFISRACSLRSCARRRPRMTRDATPFYDVGGHVVYPPDTGRARRDYARSLCDADRRRNSASADLRTRHPCRWDRAARHPALGACDGALIASIVLVWLPLRRNVGRVMFASVAIFGLMTIVFGLSRWFPLSLVALVVMGAGDMVSGSACHSCNSTHPTR